MFSLALAVFEFRALFSVSSYYFNLICLFPDKLRSFLPSYTLFVRFKKNRILCENLASTGVHSKVVDMLSMMQCLLLLPLFVGALCSDMFCNAELSVLFSFAIVSLRKGGGGGGGRLLNIYFVLAIMWL